MKKNKKGIPGFKLSDECVAKFGRLVKAFAKSCPQCGSTKYKRAMLPDQVGKGLHEAMFCGECGYEDGI